MLKFNSPIIIVSLILFSIYILIYIISKIECIYYKISFFDVKNKKNSDKIKIIYLSDFHDKRFKKDYDVIINDIVKHKPDCIVLGGDFVDFSTIQSKLNKVKFKNAMNFITKLSRSVHENLGKNNYNLSRIFFGFGNHELRLKDRNDSDYLNKVYDDFIKCLKDNDVNILEDNTYDITDGITLSGLNLYNGYYTNALSKKVVIKNIDEAILNKHFSNIDTNKFNIMAFHKPDYADDFFNHKFDLVLSGHNHGGLIKFPFIGPIFSPDLKLFPKYNSGKYDVGDKTLIVSSGIGEHFIKLRVNNRPEICVIHIN